MYQKFNENNINTKFIKDLLKDTYIPTVPVWKEGDPIIKDFIYVTKEYIVKGLVDYKPSNDIIDKTIAPRNSDYFKILKPYEFGKFYEGTTNNFESASSIYDSETHKQLGNYLRSIRDFYNIDLMQYYNCWNNAYSDKIRLVNNSYITNNTSNDGFKCLLVPIKFHKKYTIYINSNYPIKIKPVFYDGLDILSQTNNLKYDIETINSISFSNPFIYKSPDLLSTDISSRDVVNNILLENYLTLIIQLPDNVSSNVLILEGDYSQSKFITTTNDEGYFTKINALPKVYFGDVLSDLSEKDQNKMFLSVPSLSRNISSNSYAYSDRLIEYLLLNVITSQETISDNILRVQQYSSSYKNLKTNKSRYYKRYVKGVWDIDLREYVYTLVTENENAKRIDINGFVDKDSEEILLGGK